MAPIKLVCGEVSLTEGPGRRAGIGRGWQCGTQVWFWSIFAPQLWFTRVWVTRVWIKIVWFTRVWFTIVWFTRVWASSVVLNRRHKTLHTKHSHLPLHSVFLSDPQLYYVKLFHFFMSSFPRIFSFRTWYLWPVNRKGEKYLCWYLSTALRFSKWPWTPFSDDSKSFHFEYGLLNYKNKRITFFRCVHWISTIAICNQTQGLKLRP